MSIDRERIERARAMWRYVGEDRPPFARAPGHGQESVWDYPRPPRLAPDARLVVVKAGDIEVARSARTLRVLETASPPTFYIPAADVLAPAEGNSHCEWKGRARYWSLKLLAERRGVAWCYPEPLPPYEALADYFGFYPQYLDCFVDGVPVQPQPGDFYGGWITPELVGPFKGEEGSHGW
jgi:uncharacterized protein (DUF427 family)